MRQLQSFPVKRTLAFVLVLACLWAGFAVAQQGGNGYSGQAPIPGFDASSITLDGDVTGPASANTVSAIQHNAVVPGALVAGQALFANDAGIWAPETFQGDLSCSAANPGSCSVVSVSGATPILVTPNVVEWTKGTATPTLTIQTQTTDTAVPSLLIQGGAPFASASTNKAAGNIDVWTQAPVSGGANPYISLEQTGTPLSEIRVGYNLGGLYSNTNTIYSPGVATSLTVQSTSSLALHSTETYNDSGGLTLRSTGFTSYYAFQSPGLAGFGQPVGGLGTYPFEWSGQTGPNTVACGTGGTQTISAAQAIIPFFVVSSGTLTSTCTLDFSTNASTGSFHVIFNSTVTTSAVNTNGITIKNGTATVLVNATVLGALQATGKSGYIVDTYGTNNLGLE